jgi:uncharacterized protein
LIQNTAADRTRAFGYVIIAGIYYVLAERIAMHAASGLSSGDWFLLLERLFFLFLLILGYAAMGRLFQRQRTPVRAMGLPFRPGWKREFGLGAALGWGMLVVTILPMVFSRGMVVSFWLIPRQFILLILDVLLLAAASLAEEVAFRGYPFQRLIDALGPFLATMVASVIFAAAHMFNPGANRASFLVTVFSSWLLSAAYLRTRALWLAWGWHFAWNASMTLLFGLPVSGITQFSPVIQSNTIGPFWMTGGNYGPEASVVAAIVILVGIFLVYRVTRSLDYVHNQPVIVAGGIPVDLDAMSNVLAPHHQAEVPVAPAGSTLVQIIPAAPSRIPPAPASQVSPAELEQERREPPE